MVRLPNKSNVTSFSAKLPEKRHLMSTTPVMGEVEVSR